MTGSALGLQHVNFCPCGTKIEFYHEDVMWWRSRGLALPKHCANCRQKRRAERYQAEDEAKRIRESQERLQVIEDALALKREEIRLLDEKIKSRKTARKEES